MPQSAGLHGHVPQRQTFEEIEMGQMVLVPVRQPDLPDPRAGDEFAVAHLVGACIDDHSGVLDVDGMGQGIASLGPAADEAHGTEALFFRHRCSSNPLSTYGRMPP
jgi:hypothetical protein